MIPTRINIEVVNDVLNWDSERLFILFARQYAPELLEQNDDVTFENETDEHREYRMKEYEQKTNLVMEKIDILMNEWSHRLMQEKKNVVSQLEQGIQVQEVHQLQSDFL